MKKTVLVSVVLLWVWIAATLSLDYHMVYVETGEIFTMNVPRVYGESILLSSGKVRRSWVLDERKLMWLLLPPVILSPLLRKLWNQS